MYRRLLMGLALVFGSAISTNTMATVISPSLNQWYSFDVDEFIAQDAGLGWIDAQVDSSTNYMGDGSPLSFAFTLSASSILSLVDGGYAGDIFGVWINDLYHQSTSVLVNSQVEAALDFESALKNSSFSHLTILLAPGDYIITGELVQSAQDIDGVPLNATVGGLRISSVDEPSTLLLMLSMSSIFLLRRYRRLANAELLK